MVSWRVTCHGTMLLKCFVVHRHADHDSALLTVLWICFFSVRLDLTDCTVAGSALVRSIPIAIATFDSPRPCDSSCTQGKTNQKQYRVVANLTVMWDLSVSPSAPWYDVQSTPRSRHRHMNDAIVTSRQQTLATWPTASRPVGQGRRLASESIPPIAFLSTSFRSHRIFRRSIAHRCPEYLRARSFHPPPTRS
jgi:hypothetical protein